MREIAISGGEPPLRVYDTGGPQGQDIREGLALLADTLGAQPYFFGDRVTALDVYSAAAMNTSGRTLPSVGWFQRASASKPSTRPVPRSTIGW